MQPNNHQPRAKRLLQRQLRHGSSVDSSCSKRQRFWPCPVCNRSFALFLLEDHVNQCLDCPPSNPRSPSSPSGTANPSPGLSSGATNLPACVSPLSAVVSHSCPPLVRLARQDASLSVNEDGPVSCLVSIRAGGAAADTCRPSQSPTASPLCSGKLSATGPGEKIPVNSNTCRLQSSCVSHACVDECVHRSDLQNPVSAKHQDGSSLLPTKGFPIEDRALQPLNETVVCKGRGFCSVDIENDEKDQLSGESDFARNNPRDIGSGHLSAERLRNDGLQEKELPEDMRDGNGQALDRPPAGFKLFQRQVQSQARLSMFNKFTSSASLRRKPTVIVLQPGMVLFRSWLDMEIQQKLVLESQGVAPLFHRPTTSGGGKYHVYSMCWGRKWDSKAHRYFSKGPEQQMPPWMFDLSQKLARDAQHHTAVYPSDSIFTPDVGLVNFYPVKAGELGVIGLGGHQDLHDSSLMPVVSVSVGDSMTFFYRRLPPLSRRKSGILISVDEKAAKSCEDGDVAHNRENQLVLESGDVLVFGGQSRLVYHGTRHVKPGTRPPGLHMVPGRLNFTFRQTISDPV